MENSNTKPTSRWIYHIVIGSLSGWIAISGYRDFYSQSVSDLTFGEVIKLLFVSFLTIVILSCIFLLVFSLIKHIYTKRLESAANEVAEANGTDNKQALVPYSRQQLYIILVCLLLLFLPLIILSILSCCKLHSFTMLALSTLCSYSIILVIFCRHYFKKDMDVNFKH